jgi:ABC-type Co2+ transport system permease subunit
VNQDTAQVLAGFSLIAVTMGVAVIESLITGPVVSYIGKMRSDLLAGDGN